MKDGARYVKSAALVAVLAITGCGLRIRDVTLQDAAGHKVVCRGDSMITPTQSRVAGDLMRGCIEDFQRQGYQRLPD